jgi:hypothetical protein
MNVMPRIRPCRGLAVLLATAACLSPALPALAASDRQSVEELRNTVTNILQALVDQGVLTKDKAAALVKQAQERAATEAATAEAVEDGAVRVTHVPQIVKDELRKEVAADLRKTVAADVVAQARTEQWGVPGAMPDWLKQVRLYGDLRLRGEGIYYGHDNLRGEYLNFVNVNNAGGIIKAGADAFTNVSIDRYRSRVLGRFGAEADLSSGIRAGLRLATGTLPASEWQTEGTTGARYTVALDEAYLRWDADPGAAVSWLTLQGGRTLSPYLSTEMLFHRDLNFEGFTGTYRYALPWQEDGSHAYLTLGAHPIQEVALSARDKWLLAAQLGAELRFGDDHRLRTSLAYYDFHHIQGVRNALNSKLTDFTAPAFMQTGNSMFDIRTDVDPTTNLFALAGKYRLVNAIVAYEVPVTDSLQLSVLGDYVRNVGWKTADVLAESGLTAKARTSGYSVELGFGNPTVRRAGRWRSFLTYRYLQRDAVVDAFNDQDFHAGGTDARGYIVGADLGVARDTWLRVRYLAAEQIDGAPYAVDTLQIDLNAAF